VLYFDKTLYYLVYPRENQSVIVSVKPELNTNEYLKAFVINCQILSLKKTIYIHSIIVNVFI